jgi:hypothetical protein
MNKENGSENVVVDGKVKSKAIPVTGESHVGTNSRAFLVTISSTKRVTNTPQF